MGPARRTHAADLVRGRRCDRDYRDRRYAGRVVVATFSYSTCKDTCPLVVQQLSQGIGELRHTIPAVAISVDPAQDTPANVKAFLVKEQVVGQLQTDQMNSAWLRSGSLLLTGCNPPCDARAVGRYRSAPQRPRAP